MRIFLASLFTIISFTVYSQPGGIITAPAPYNHYSEHFLFSTVSDTIINGSWTQLANYPVKLIGVNCYYWPATGKIFTCGGLDSAGFPSKACYFYDPASNNYTTADSLPKGRCFGKLVRVKDSLYLVGSIGSSFTSPDGIIYKYSPAQNQWVVKDTMPAPRLHESAVCVIGDSVIFLIGGSTDRFAGPTSIVRQYDPAKRTWKTYGSFPVPITTAHAEHDPGQASIVVAGGYYLGYNNIVYRGLITFLQPDSLAIEWRASALNDTSIFHAGVYRVGGAKAGDWMLFGPALNEAITYNTVYAVGFADDTTGTMYWKRMVPNIPDSAGNRPTIAVNVVNDSAHIFLFGGSVGLIAVNTSYKYSFQLPGPIGIEPNANSIAQNFILKQNYPNPFNPKTKIQFEFPAGIKNISSDVKLAVYDILGREIAVLVNSKLKPGKYEIDFDGTNLASGIFLCILFSGDTKLSNKMILLK